MIQAVIATKINSILQEMKQIMVFITYISFLDIHFTRFITYIPFLDIHFTRSETNYSFKDMFTIVNTQIPTSTNKLLTITQAVIAVKI